MKLKYVVISYNGYNIFKMDTLPNELILLIFDYILLITDKRQFLKTCKFHNNLTKQSMLNYEINYEVKFFRKIKEYCVEKFTLELCHDKYFDMIPKHYIIPNNKILVKSLAAFNCVKLLQIAMELNFDSSEIPKYAALYGSLEVLQWAKSINLNMDIIILNNNSFNNNNIRSIVASQENLKLARLLGNNTDESNICIFAASQGHLNILKWAREIGLKMDNLICYYAVLGRHLKILNWINEIDDFYIMVLEKYLISKGDDESVKWINDNYGSNLEHNFLISLMQ